MKKKSILLVILLLVSLVIPNSSSMLLVNETISANETTVIIMYHDNVTEQQINELIEHGATIKYVYDIIPAVSVRVNELLLEDLKQNEEIKAIYEDKCGEAALDHSVPQIHADEIHLDGVTGSGVKVCIVDSGVDDSHPNLNPLVAEWDFVNDDADATDDNGHGTHVAGIIASTHPTYRGVAPGASLMAAKVLDSSNYGWGSHIIAGIDWAVQNDADIISVSICSGAYIGKHDADPIAIAANNAVDQGVIVVAASGNNGYTKSIAAPACGSKVIAVGAIDDYDTHASYSNGGTGLNLVAPGNEIISTSVGGGFVKFTGTSMACPHVSGVAALLLEMNPALNPADIQAILQDTAEDLGAPGFDNLYGYGKVNAKAAYHSASGHVFWDDFEHNYFTEWIEGDGNGWWLIKYPEGSDIIGKSSSNHVAHADTCNSPDGLTLTMKNSVDLTTYTTVRLSFWRYIDDGLDPGEYLKVEAYNGQSWNTICYWTDGQGDDDQWHRELIELPEQYLVDNFRIRFTSKESSWREFTEIDDILIEGDPIDVNSPPRADAGPDQTANDNNGDGNELVTLDGTGSFDPDFVGAIESYEWMENNKSLGTEPIIEINLPIGIHVVTLTVTDNMNASDTDEVIITVNPNPPPVADAGDDQTVTDHDDNGFEIVTLDGSNSYDPGSFIESFEWKEGSTTLGTSQILPKSFDVGEHTVTLTITDFGGATDSDTVIINVTSKGQEPDDPQPSPPENGDIVFFDDFQNGNLEKWVDVGGNGYWIVKSPEGKNIPGKLSSNKICHADQCNIPTIIRMKNSVDLSAYATVNLSFWRYVDNDLSTGEYLRVEAYNGQSWDTIYYWTDGQGDDDQWHHETLMLPEKYLISVFNLQFTSKESSWREFTEIDDVMIEGTSGEVNNAPVADAGNDQTVSDHDDNGFEIVTLDGSSSYDLDGNIVSYEWNEDSTPLGNTEEITPNLSIGTHTITLTVTDDDGATGTDTVVITVIPKQANLAPTADAGDDQTVSDHDDNGFETVILDGSNSYDTDGSIESYEWKENSNTLGTFVILTSEFPVGTHTITLAVTDDDGATDTDTVIVIVEEPPSPEPEEIFFDDFQNGNLEKWVDVGGNGYWIVKSPEGKNIPGRPSSNKICHADQCNIPTIIRMKNSVDLSAYTTVNLSFWRYVDNDLSTGEYLRVEAYDGQSWNTICYWTDGQGDDDQWHHETLMLPEKYLISDFNLQFTSKESSWREFTEIDDILIEGIPK